MPACPMMTVRMVRPLARSRPGVATPIRLAMPSFPWGGFRIPHTPDYTLGSPVEGCRAALSSPEGRSLLRSYGKKGRPPEGEIFGAAGEDRTPTSFDNGF